MTIPLIFNAMKMMDKTKMILSIQMLATCLSGFVEGVCDQAAAQACLSSYQNELVMAASDLTQLQALCGSDSVNQQASACVASALSEEECQETASNYRAQLKLLEDGYDQSCAALQDMPDGQGMCELKFISDCAEALFQAVGNGEEGLAHIYAKLIPLEGDSQNANQKESCNKISGMDYGHIKNCIIQNGCAEGNAMPTMDDVTGIPTITYIDVVEIIEGICKPGCEDFSTKYESAKQCMADNPANDYCSTIEEHFSCMRHEIGSCATLRTFIEKGLSMEDINHKVQEKCPGLDISLDPSEEKNSAPVLTSAHVLYVLPFTIVATLHIHITVFLQSS